MKPSAKSRKPANELTATDLQAFPIWEFAVDEEAREEQDETWVRPVLSNVVRSGSSSQVVATKFVTGSGVEAMGYLVISPRKCERTKLAHSGGGIIAKDQQAFLARFDGPMADFMKRDSIRAISELLGLSDGDLFPLKYEVAAIIEGEAQPRNGVFDYTQKA